MVVPESGSGSEGIKVHGDWTVEVTNPDGSLATRKQFSNHITEEGFGFLAALMTHDQSDFNRRIKFLFVPNITESAAGRRYPDGVIFCNDAEVREGSMGGFYFPLNPEAGSVISADQKGSIWTAGCTVSLRPNYTGDVTSTEIATISGMASFNQNAGSFVTISQQDLLPRIEVVVGQYISATVVYSFK